MDLAALVSQFGPWVGLAVYGVIAFFRERQRRDEAMDKAREAHLADFRAWNAEGKAAVAAMVTTAAELKELRREVRRDDRDSEPEEKQPVSRKSGR